MSIPADAVPLRGWPDAFIAPDGRIWRNGREKAVFVAKNGYKTVNFSRQNKSHCMTLHRLLALHFIGPAPSAQHEVCHINGDPLDNRLENLRWGTRADNVRDAIRHGTATIGARNGAAKLRASDVLFMRDMRELGFFLREIAPHFGISQSTVQRVITNQTYKDCNERV